MGRGRLRVVAAAPLNEQRPFPDDEGAVAPRTGPNRPPRDSASLVIYENKGGSWHVLMGVRSKKHAFFPDALAFPGGAVDPTDWAVPVAAPLSHATDRLLRARPRRRLSQRRTVAIAAAALREAYEEAGILIGGEAAPGARPPRDWQPFFAHGLAPDLSGLDLFMRAITPPGRTRRFDNRFFAIDAARIAKALPPEECPTQELEQRRFLPLDEALEMHMPRVTKIALKELRGRLSMPNGLADGRPVPFLHTVRGNFIREEIS